MKRTIRVSPGLRARGSGQLPRPPTPDPRTALRGSDPAVLRRVARSHNLTDEAYERIVRILGRRPTITEIGIFGVMWSEHCSYCSSRPYLKQFPTKGPRVLVPAGQENAGLVDIGGGLAVAFKVE